MWLTQSIKRDTPCLCFMRVNLLEYYYKSSRWRVAAFMCVYSGTRTPDSYDRRKDNSNLSLQFPFFSVIWRLRTSVHHPGTLTDFLNEGWCHLPKANTPSLKLLWLKLHRNPVKLYFTPSQFRLYTPHKTISCRIANTTCVSAFGVIFLS